MQLLWPLIKALGADPILISVVGQDDIASNTLEELEKLQIKNSLIQDKGGPLLSKKIHR